MSQKIIKWKKWEKNLNDYLPKTKRVVKYSQEKWLDREDQIPEVNYGR